MLDTQGPGSFRPAYPFHMVWLSTNGCNARCLHCSSSSSRRTPDELDTEEVKAMVDQLEACGVVDLGISGGEPLLRKDLFDIIRHARQRGMTVGVGSNGTTLTPRLASRLVESDIGRFQVSLDGLKASHEALRCWPGMFERVLRTIALARQRGLRVHICCTINRLNVEELENFVDFVCGLDVQRINFSRYVPTGRGEDSLDLKEREWHDVIRQTVALRDRFRQRIEIVSHLAQQILIDPEVAEMAGFIGCQAGIGQGCITANGTVLPCVLLPIDIGNIRQRPFAEIWRDSPIIQTLKARDRLQGACGECALNQRCGGCRAVAFAKTGDYLSTDRRCWLATGVTQADEEESS